jgi:hypothetical protein
MSKKRSSNYFRTLFGSEVNHGTGLCRDKSEPPPDHTETTNTTVAPSAVQGTDPAMNPDDHACAPWKPGERLLSPSGDTIDRLSARNAVRLPTTSE